MGAVWLHDTPKFLRKYNVRFETYPGWEVRSRRSGGLERVLAVGTHHTASAAPAANQMAWMWNNSGDRPIGNIFIARDGLVTLGAAGAANTQGRGGPITTSKGTIPKDQGNMYCVAIEAANNGVGQEWPDAQMRAYVLVCAALCEQFGLNPLTDILSHWEYVLPSQPGRKIDPAGPTPSMPEIGGTDGARRWNDAHFKKRVSDAMKGTTSPSPVPTPPSNTYVVQHGDSWWKIAATHLGSGSRWTEIAALNNNVVLRPGMTITLPRGATAPPKPAPAPPITVASPILTPPAFDPANGRYGDWPTRTAKPTLRRGAKGDAVRYLQGVISNKAGGNISVDGNFGPQTEARVKDCQRLTRAKTSGIVGKQVWAFIDILSK